MAAIGIIFIFWQTEGRGTCIPDGAVLMDAGMSLIQSQMDAWVFWLTRMEKNNLQYIIARIPRQPELLLTPSGCLQSPSHYSRAFVL